MEEALAWQGWSATLKPANGPICLVRKPYPQYSLIECMMTYGTGALHIDSCRIPRQEIK